MVQDALPRSDLLQAVLQATAMHARRKGDSTQFRAAVAQQHRPASTTTTTTTNNNNNQRRAATGAATIHSLYEIQRTLGSGANGVVKLGVHRQTGQAFAIKIIDKHRFLNQTSSRRPDLYAEVNILRRVKHPSVTRFENMIETKDLL